MTLEAYAVYDEKAGGYAHPFFVVAPGLATRMFTDWTNGDTPIAKHPGDYKLYKVGSFDDQEGVFRTLATPEFVVSATDVCRVQAVPPAPRLRGIEEVKR